jgi:hypothetical protein
VRRPRYPQGSKKMNTSRCMPGKRCWQRMVSQSLKDRQARWWGTELLVGHSTTWIQIMA